MRTNLPKLGVTWGNCAARPGCLGGLSNDSSIAAPLFLISPDKPQGHRLFIATICHRPPLWTCLWARVKASVVCKETT